MMHKTAIEICEQLHSLAGQKYVLSAHKLHFKNMVWEFVQFIFVIFCDIQAEDVFAHSFSTDSTPFSKVVMLYYHV